MKLTRFVILLFLIATITAACAPSELTPAAPQPPATPQVTPPPSAIPPSPTAQPTPAPQPTSQDLPEAASKALQALAQQAGVPADQIKVVRVEEVEWPDGCLGIRKPGIMCTQVITPGYRVVLEAAGKTYEVRTDRTGSQAELAENALQPVLRWELQGETCQTASITAAGLQYGPCKGSLKNASFIDPKRAAELELLIKTYQSFSADTKAGKVTFNGQGQQKPSPAEQRSVAEWARLTTMEATRGQSQAAYDLAITWRREGGIAGFCDDLSVYLTGFAYASSCKNGPAKDAQVNRLESGEIDQLYTWTGTYKTFSIKNTDQAKADAMTVQLSFVGSGAKDPTPEEKQSIQTRAADLYARIQKQPK